MHTGPSGGLTGKQMRAQAVLLFQQYRETYQLETELQGDGEWDEEGTLRVRQAAQLHEQALDNYRQHVFESGVDEHGKPFRKGLRSKSESRQQEWEDESKPFAQATDNLVRSIQCNSEDRETIQQSLLNFAEHVLIHTTPAADYTVAKYRSMTVKEIAQALPDMKRAKDWYDWDSAYGFSTD